MIPCPWGSPKKKGLMITVKCSNTIITSNATQFKTSPTEPDHETEEEVEVVPANEEPQVLHPPQPPPNILAPLSPAPHLPQSPATPPTLGGGRQVNEPGTSRPRRDQCLPTRLKNFVME